MNVLRPILVGDWSPTNIAMTVDLFVFPNHYIDLATIGEVCRLSGGQIYKFNYFSVSLVIIDFKFI